MAQQGKPRSESRKATAVIKARVTPEEKAEAEARCRAEGVTMSGAIKAAILKRPAKAQPQQIIGGIDRAELSRLMVQLSKIGGNVNQIAHHLNQGNSLEQEQARQLEESLLAIRDAVFKTLGHSKP